MVCFVDNALGRESMSPLSKPTWLLVSDGNICLNRASMQGVVVAHLTAPLLEKA